MLRPPSREDVQTAQSHLVLLKSKMRQRQLQAPPLSAGLPEQHQRADRFDRAPSGGAVSSEGFRGVTWDPPTAQHGRGQTPLAGPPPPPSELDQLHALGDQKFGRRPFEDGYPSSPSQARGAGMAHSPVGGGPSSGGIPDGMLDELDDGIPLVPCPDCGRKFKEDRLDKHIKICQKVFATKRKQFNSAANRLGELENAGDLIANAKQIEKEKEKQKENQVSQKKEKNMPKWKAQSLAFRQAILAAKGDSGDADAAAQAQELQQELNAAKAAGGGEEADMLKCPHCGRTFNKEAGERHIAICVKTFGGKPGGGRLAKGSGTGSSGMGIKAKPPSTPPGASSRVSSTGTAAARKPSAQRRVSGGGSQAPPRGR